MTDKAETPKKAEEPKKPKKLKIVDANEPEETKGDTPPLADEAELAAIAEAFNDPQAAPEAKAEPKPKAPKKIAITEHVEETPAEASTEEAPKEEELAAETPADDVLAEEAPQDETTADEPPAETPAEEPEADAEPESESESEPEPEEELAKPRPLSQLTNNVPQPPKPVEDIVAAIEPEKEFADDQMAKAVDDIVAKESDELLEKEDEAAKAVVKPAPKRKFSFKAFFSTWWHSPAARWGTVVGLVLLLAMIAALPASRYGILNAAGVRVTSNMTILSNDNQQPLKNAKVQLAGQTATTNEDGQVSFTKLRLGKTQLEISKRGYASIEQTRTLGWGSNPLGSIGMTLTGTKFIFTVKDVLSAKAVTGAEAVTGDFNAQSDANGKIILAVDQSTDTEFKVTIKASGYRDETINVKLSETGDHPVNMAAEKPRVFVSKRSGKLDIYRIDADGKNEKQLLAGTGKERNDLALLQQPSGEYSAIVSTRNGTRNKDGYLLSNLFVMNNNTGELTKLNESERIQLIDWSGDRILFIAVTQGASAANPNRSKIFSYQIGQPGAKQLASANYFNDALIYRNQLYFAPSSYAVPVASVKFFKVNVDGSSQSTVLNSEVWNIFRSDYDVLQLSVQQDWYELKAGANPQKMSSAPANPKTRVYRDSPDGKHSLWVDSRDGKGVLISYDVAAKNETTLVTQSGLQQPVFWLNNTTYVYRISDGRETADYVRSTEGGAAKKLRDVTSTDSSNYFN